VTANPDLLTALEALGFDVKSGIELCGGDSAFYCDLIRELHSDVLVRRDASLRGGNADARREYAHLLKGTLQVLGETRASMKARALEQALREGAPDLELTDILATDLDRLNQALDSLLSS
jgi:HPt (histidine-containing phosphotransfer) domain-containing protein